MASLLSIQPGEIIDEESLISSLSEQETMSWLLSLDAVLILGGGVPLAPKEPPTYVQRRCDVVAKLFNRIDNGKEGSTLPNILCLSAGTAHLPQYILPNDGLPLWESTSSAAYLMHHPKHHIDENRLFVETTSYDTISNAFYARTGFTDVAGWKRLLVVTNEFHIHRSKAIFDWIFSVPAEHHTLNYEIFYLSCSNVGLSSEAIEARRSHEERGESNVRTILEKEYTTLQDVFRFLTTKHDFYTAKKLVDRATTSSHGEKVRDKLLELSYGTPSSKTHHKSGSSTFEIKERKIHISVDVFTALAIFVAALGVCLLVLQNSRASKSHAHIN